MPLPSKVFAPEEFVAQLKSGALSVGEPLAFMGMVKAAEDDQHVLFASGPNSDASTKLPLGLIESIEFRDVASCQDHTHPLVRLYVKEPRSEEAKAFASLTKEHLLARPRSAPAEGQMPEPTRNPTPRRGRRCSFGMELLPLAP